MKHNPSTKYYRGFKYIVLVLLIFAAIGVFFFSKGGQQLDDPQAKLKEAASSLTAGVGEAGKRLADKAKETGSDLADKATKIKDDVAESMAKDRDAVTASVRDATQAAQDPVASATDDKFEEATAAVVETTDTIAAGAGEQGQHLMGKAGEIKVGAVETPAQGSLQSTADTSAVPGLAGDRVDSPATSGTPGADAANQPQVNQAAVQVGDMPESAPRCAGPPPMGKDLGTRYIVASCENLSIISQRTGIGVEKIWGQNPQIKNPDLIYPNQELRLPPRS